MQEYYPQDFAKVKKYISEGKWFVSGSSVDENDAIISSPESILRNILHGNLYFKEEFNKTSTDYMLPDCFGFPASLPTTLVHAGLKGFTTQKLQWGSPFGKQYIKIFGTWLSLQKPNWLAPIKTPFNLGTWEGVDGNSITAVLNPSRYETKLESDISLDKKWLRRVEYNGRKAGFSADFMFYGTGDKGGAPEESSVLWLEKSLAGKGKLCIVPAASDDIFKAISDVEKAKLPSYKGDLLLTEHSAGSLTSQAYMKRWNRKNELLIDAAERASVIADWLGNLPYARDRFRKTWELILNNQMHDILPGTAVPKAYEFSWNDEVIALNNSADILQNASGSIISMLDT